MIRRKKLVGCRVTDEEFHLIGIAAAIQGKTVSEFGADILVPAAVGVITEAQKTGILGTSSMSL